MSYSFDAVQSQSAQIRAIASEVDKTSIAMETNKRIVICCLDAYTSRHLCNQLRYAGIRYEMEKGIKTDRIYVQVHFSCPF